MEVLVRWNLYQKAIDVLRRYKNLSPSDQRKALAPGRTLQELCLASAELHYKGANMKEMHNSLQFVHPVEVRVEFLKKRKLLEDAANEFLKEGKAVEAAKIMREKGSFRVAADYAKRSGDSSLAADCTFAYVRSSVEMPKEEQVERLEEAKNLYKEAGQMNSFGEVLLEQAKLTADHRKAEEAGMIFSSPTIYNTCGELECVELMWDSTDDEHSQSNISTSSAVRLVNAVLQLIKSLNASNLDVMTQKEIERCEAHFGLHREGDPSKRVIRRKEGDRFLYFAQGLQKRPVPGNKWEIDLQDVRERIAEVLFDRVAKLIRQIRVLLEKTFITHETCQLFLVGFSCNSESCQYQHILPSQNTTGKLFRAILDEMWLDAQANDFHKLEKRYVNKNSGIIQWEMTSPNPKAGLENLFPRDGFASCTKLIEFFFPVGGQSASVRLQTFISYLRDGTPRFYKQRLLKFAEELWKKRATDEEKLQSADVFLTVSHLLQLIRFPQSRILSWIGDTEEKFRKNCVIQNNKPVIPKSVGIALERKGPKLIFTLFSRWWEMSKVYLHAYGDILEAGHNALRRFLTMTASPGKQLPFPSPRNCLDILEYITCVYLVLFARLQQSQKSRYLACLPAGYLSVISFWDTLNCNTSKHVGIYRAAFMYQSRPSTIRRVKKLLHDMVSLMLGGYSKNFNVLKKVLHCSESIYSGEAERALVLVLTLLCNSGQSVPYESEIRLLGNLYTEPPAGVSLPDRIALCLKQVQEAKGIQDIVVILQNLLRERQEELCSVRWDNFHQRLWWDKVNPSGYRGTFFTDVLDKLAQTTVELPAEDVPESGDVEGSLVDEFGADEEHLTRDAADQSRNDKLEAIEREEVVQAESWEEPPTAEEAIPGEAPVEQDTNEDPINSFFSSFRVDQSGCGVCNVRFSQAKSDNSQISLKDREKQLADKNPVSSNFAEHSTLQSHQAVNSPHWKKMEEFTAYRKLFQDELLPHQTKLNSVLSQADSLLRTAEQQGRPLSILSTKVDEVHRANNSVIETTSVIQQQCNWADLESFKEAIASLGEALKTCEEEISSENSRTTGWLFLSI